MDKRKSEKVQNLPLKYTFDKQSAFACMSDFLVSTYSLNLIFNAYSVDDKMSSASWLINQITINKKLLQVHDLQELIL